LGGAGYGEIDWQNPDTSERPRPVRIGVSVPAVAGADNELLINDTAEAGFINDGCTILDDETGTLYRVLERYRGDRADTIAVDPDLTGDPDYIWVIPPPVDGGRNPCIAVYQKVMKL
jgi:hypothetical protein